MARTQTVEAIVLKTKNFGEADRLLTVFTKQLGKLTILAKGVRRITSRRSGNLDLLNHVTITLVKGQSFWLATEAQVISPFPKLKQNLTSILYAYYIAELVNALTVDEQVQPDVYGLLLQTLTHFERNPRRIVLVAFEQKILHQLGFFSEAYLQSQETDVIALARALRVQSLEEISKKSYDEGTIVTLDAILRRRLVQVAEKEFASQKVVVELKKYLK